MYTAIFPYQIKNDYVINIHQYTKFEIYVLKSKSIIKFWWYVKIGRKLNLFCLQKIPRTAIARRKSKKTKQKIKIRALLKYLKVAPDGAVIFDLFNCTMSFHFIYFRKFFLGGNTELPFDLCLFCFYFYLAL